MAPGRQPPSADFPLSRKHHVGCGTPRASRRGRWRALVLLGVHVAVVAHVVHWKLAGSTLSPLEPSEAQETFRYGYVNAGFVLLLLSVFATLVFGRFFCGWACHVVAYQDACAWVLGRLRLRPQPVRSRLLMLVPLYAAFDLFLLPFLANLIGDGLPALSWHLTAEDFWATFPGPVMSVATIVVVGFLIVWFLGAKGFCTYACPYGALFGIADRFARGRIRVTDACEGCGHCTQTCTSNVRVHEEVAKFGQVVDPGCMKCMDCVDVCPKDALYFGFGGSRAGAVRGSKKHKKTRYDFVWPEELAMALVFVVGIYAFRGLFEAVPFLLALALAVLAAASAVVLWRLVRRPSVTLQHAPLKRDGRFTAAGVAAVALFPAYLAFTGHSAFLQYHVHEGERLLESVRTLPGAERERALEGAAEHLGTAARHSLVPSSRRQNQIGQSLAALGRFDEAEHHLRRALELDPTNASAGVYLAGILTERGELDAACEELARVLAADPLDPGLPGVLRRVLRERPDHPRANELLREVADARAAR